MGWYEAIKDALTVADNFKNADLIRRLVDVQMEGAKLAEENGRLRQELADLREQARTRQQMQYENNVYWRQTTEGKREGPFCPKCLDGNNKPSRMSDFSDFHAWICPVCNCSIPKPGRSQEVLHTETDFDLD